MESGSKICIRECKPTTCHRHAWTLFLCNSGTPWGKFLRISFLLFFLLIPLNFYPWKTSCLLVVGERFTLRLTMSYDMKVDVTSDVVHFTPLSYCFHSPGRSSVWITSQSRTRFWKNLHHSSPLPRIRFTYLISFWDFVFAALGHPWFIRRTFGEILPSISDSSIFIVALCLHIFRFSCI